MVQNIRSEQIGDEQVKNVDLDLDSVTAVKIANGVDVSTKGFKAADTVKINGVETDPAGLSDGKVYVYNAMLGKFILSEIDGGFF